MVVAQHIYIIIVRTVQGRVLLSEGGVGRKLPTVFHTKTIQIITREIARRASLRLEVDERDASPGVQVVADPDRLVALQRYELAVQVVIDLAFVGRPLFTQLP